MSDAYSFGRDLDEAEAMVKALLPYLQRDELYGRVGTGSLFAAPNMPSLTVGALRLRLRRLDALRDHLTERQIAQLTQIEDRHQAIYTERTKAYQQKMLREAESRLKAMTTFFEECIQNPRTCAGIYKPEALRRTIVYDLMAALEDFGVLTDELKQRARSTDSQLRRQVQPAPFLWEAELQPAYPDKIYWWLYHAPARING